jgi:hypothetical protein
MTFTLLVDLAARKTFAENVWAQTRERIQKKALQAIQRHEKKYNVRVFLAGEIVLVDVGPRDNVHRKRVAVKGVIVEGLTNNYYVVEFTEGNKIGDQQDFDAARIEPLRKKERVMSAVTPQRKAKAPKKTKLNTKKAVAPKPTLEESHPDQPSEKKRSEAHWFQQSNNLLTLERSNRSARAKLVQKGDDFVSE